MRMRSWLWLLVILCLGLLATHLSIEPLYTPTALSTPAQHAFFPRYIAHKALLSGSYTGNTLGAIQETLASYVDGLELDIRLSKDNIPFVYHGDTLEEATTGQGFPEDHAWKDLQLLSYKDESQSKLLALEDVFKLVGSQKDVFLDIKTNKIFNGKFAEVIASLIHKYHLEDSVIVESLNPLFLLSMRLIARDILLMYDFTGDATAQAKKFNRNLIRSLGCSDNPFFKNK